jgi:sporulation integral membrane protein YtvI
LNIWEDSLIRRKLIITAIITTLVVYFGFLYLLPLILPFVVAYFLAWIVRPLTEFLYRRLKLPRIVGGSISLLLLIAAIGTVLFFLINNLMKQIFAFIKNLPIYLSNMADQLDFICQSCDEFLGLSSGTIRTIVDENMFRTLDRVKNNIMPGITEHTISFIIKFIGAIGVLLITFIATMLIVKDLPSLKECIEGNKLYQDFHRITERLADTGIAYLRTQLIIMNIVAVICVLGLTILKNEYALLLGIGIAIMDALPILGSGIIFIPWCIIMLFNGNIYAAAILITIYLLCQVVREILEPKLIGKCIGLRPLFTLMAMYIGVQLFSIAGFALGPIGLVIIITTVRVVKEKLTQAYACTDEEDDLSYSDD